MTDPAVERLRHFLMPGVTNCVVWVTDLEGIVQVVRGASAEPQRIELLERLYDAARLWALSCAVANEGKPMNDRWPWEYGENLIRATEAVQPMSLMGAGIGPSEPLATVPQEAKEDMLPGRAHVADCARPDLHDGPCEPTLPPAVSGAPDEVGIEPLLRTPESLHNFLTAAAQELARVLPDLQIVLGKITAAKKISTELLKKRMDI